MKNSPAVWLAREALPTFRALSLRADDLESMALGRLHRILEQVAKTEFGRRRLRAAGVSPEGAMLERDAAAILRALPPVGKGELREAGVGALVGGCVDPGWRSSRSSGSTGEPFRVFYDPRAWAILKHLVKLRARAACGLRPHHRVALLDAIPTDQEGHSFAERAGRVRRISVLQPAGRIAAALASFRPDAIYGLPSALIEAAGMLKIQGARIAPANVFTSGELLDARARRALHEGYGCPVSDVYGTSETKEIAWECSRGSLHINADVVRVEILNAAGELAPPGEEGDIVVTLLVNTAMLLVRYRTGDRGSLLSDRCRCGLALPRLGIVTGREADVLELEGGHRLSPYALTTVLEPVGSLHRYQVSQLDPGRLRVRAVIGSPADRSAAESGIRSALCGMVATPLRVDVEFVDRFETGPNAKFHVVQSLRAIAGPALLSVRE